LIHLDLDNTVYTRLLSHIGALAQGLTLETSFVDWQTCHWRVMNLIRLFFLSYMTYAQAYKGAPFVS
jgi:hypothetical protein